MFKNLVQLYSLLICLIASISIMVTMGIMLSNITDIILLEYKYTNQLDKFTSNAKYIDFQKQNDSSDKEKWQTMDNNLIAEKRLADRVDYISSVKGGAISSLINCITWFITGLFFFLIHWRTYKKSSDANHLKG
jgi:hypothetical protein